MTAPPAAGHAEEGLRCGTLVLTGFPAAPPKDRAAEPPPTAPGKGRPASATL